METAFFVKMRVLINIISSIALIIQSVFSVFNVLIMKKAETLYETLYNDFIFTSYLCSNIVVLVFLLLYNFKYKCLENRLVNVFFLIIVILAAYIHIYQLFVQNDLILTSCVLLIVDIYVAHGIWKNLLC